MKKKKVSRIVVTMIAVCVAVIWWVPMLWALIVSVKPLNSVVTDIRTWFTPPFTFDNFLYVFTSEQADIFRWLLNSLLVSSIVTLGGAMLSMTAAYGFSKFEFPGKKVWFWIVMAGMMIPIHSLMIPMYLLFRQMGLLNTYASLILPGLGSSFGVILLKQFMDGLPAALFEAAKIDGANSFRILWKIVFPLMKPAMASLMIFTFLQQWNDFIWPFIAITNENIMTVPVGIVFFRGQSDMSMAYSMAATVIAVLPVLIIFFIFQKQIVKGVAFSGIKE
ncbi:MULTISPECIES: carbohydrate ABC transporter permease [Blautia]|uniref:carbohydrate ABC transporter permease n=1 Tax=Blautia TaxID=572511 RepID=UPI000BA3A26E|nr:MULTISPECIES: carbohydrate ABC transporter permease [Blautia]